MLHYLNPTRRGVVEAVIVTCWAKCYLNRLAKPADPQPRHLSTNSGPVGDVGNFSSLLELLAASIDN